MKATKNTAIAPRTPNVQTPPEARRLAKYWADQYFDALSAEVPFDTAPGGIDLVYAAVEIQQSLPTYGDAPGDTDHAALTAGYLLGVEIGKRIGGAR